MLKLIPSPLKVKRRWLRGMPKQPALITKMLASGKSGKKHPFIMPHYGRFVNIVLLFKNYHDREDILTAENAKAAENSPQAYFSRRARRSAVKQPLVAAASRAALGVGLLILW